VVADDANRIIFVNQAAGEVLGSAPEALVGQRLTVSSHRNCGRHTSRGSAASR
jgi:PAS domain-containing protein